MTIVRDDHTSTDALAIVEKYEAFRNYLYPILQRCPRKHGVFRDAALALLFSPIGALYHAAKAQNVSRLYAIDADLATLRSHLRFMANPDVKIISPNQHRVAEGKVAEVGKMLGSWIKKMRQRG